MNCEHCDRRDWEYGVADDKVPVPNVHLDSFKQAQNTVEVLRTFQDPANPANLRVVRRWIAYGPWEEIPEGEQA